MDIARFRKAIAAFIIPLLSLPIAEWISGSAVWDQTTVLSTLATAIVAAVGVYLAPNKQTPA